MSEPEPFTVTFTPAARRRLSKLPLSVATALYEHLAGPVAGNPHRLGKPLDVPFEDVLSTRRGEYRALYTVDDRARVVTGFGHALDPAPRAQLVAPPGELPAEWQ